MIRLDSLANCRTMFRRTSQRRRPSAHAVDYGDAKPDASRRFDVFVPGAALRRLIDTAAVLYTLLGFSFGIYCITRSGAVVPLLGAILLMHTTTCSALLTHELMHHTMFDEVRFNDALARVLMLISGGCYFPYAGLKQQHLKHHRVKVGYDGFSIARWVTSLPSGVQKVIVAMEYAYFPVLSIISRVRSLAIPFFLPTSAALRVRIACVFALRMVCYWLLWRMAPWSPLWLLLGWVGMLHLLRVYDCFHHTFDVLPPGTPVPQLNRDYEQNNTYSSLISREMTCLNWLFLNYGYHNAHHARPTTHWLDLPRVHRTLGHEVDMRCILFRDLVKWYHKHRIDRIYKGIGHPQIVNGKLAMDEYRGVIMNISFITYDL